MQQRGLHDGLNHRHKADVLLRLQANHVKSGICIGVTVSHMSADISLITLIDDLYAAGRQQALGLQLLAAQADDHDLTAEIRIQRDVAQRAYGDDCIRRVNRHTAAVAVFQPNHIVNIREARQQFLLDAADGKINHASYTLHSGGNGEDVARTDRAIWVAVALEGVAFKRGLRRWFDCSHRQAFKAARCWHLQQAFVHPAAGRNVFERIANRYVVAQHCRTFGQVN